jgi:hypothetical protein
VGVTGKNRFSNFITGFLSGSNFFSGAKNIFIPVKIKKAPNIYTTALYCMSTEPAAMKIPLKIMAPRIP